MNKPDIPDDAQEIVTPERITFDQLKSKRSNQKKGVLILGIVILTLILAGVLYFLFKPGNNINSTNKNINYGDFPVNAFMTDPASFSGNHYQAIMRVESQLVSKSGKGRLFVVKEKESNNPLPIFVPDNLDQFNFEKGQLLQLQFFIKDGGLIYVESIKKP